MTSNSTMGTYVVDINEAPPLVMTVSVGGLSRFKARWWLAARIFAFGSWVAGCELEFEFADDES